MSKVTASDTNNEGQSILVHLEGKKSGPNATDKPCDWGRNGVEFGGNGVGVSEGGRSLSEA